MLSVVLNLKFAASASGTGMQSHMTIVLNNNDMLYLQVEIE